LDLLTGSPEARRSIEAGAPLEPLHEQWKTWIEAFEAGLDDILLYRR
jgi:hypothetical protein